MGPADVRQVAQRLNLGHLRCPICTFPESILARIAVEPSRSSIDPHQGASEPLEVLMTKHRTITGFVAVALLAVVATAATVRSPSIFVASTGTGTLKGLAVDANKLPAASFDDRWSAMSTTTIGTPER